MNYCPNCGHCLKTAPAPAPTTKSEPFKWPRDEAEALSKGWTGKEWENYLHRGHPDARFDRT